MDEFFNPKATVTPGALGAFMMLIANTICHVFPEIPFRFAAIILSLMIAATSFTFYTNNITIPKKIVLWILNSLVIFTIGIGSTNIAANVEESSYASLFNNAYAAGNNATRGNETLRKRMDEYYRQREIKNIKEQQQQQFFKRW